jgi:TolB-like protein
MRLRNLAGAIGAATAVCTLPTISLAQNTAASPPAVAIIYFDNGAMVRTADYAPLSKGLADMLITDLASNPAIKVVERDRLQQIIAELDLNQSDKIDKSNALKIGKLLGARYLLTGGFAIDQRETLRIDVRAVNQETSAIEYVETVTGKADDVFGLVSQLSDKINKHMPSRLASGQRDTPKRDETKRDETKPDEGKRTEAKRDETPPPAGNRFRAVMLLSRAMNEQDRGNTQSAIALYKEAIQVYPNYDRARVLLANLEKKSSSGE